MVKIHKTDKITEEISKLFNAKELQDPENDIYEDTKAKLTSFDRSKDQESGEESDVDNQLSEFRKKNILLLKDVDRKYRGKITSRKEFESDDNSAADSSGDDEEESNVGEEENDLGEEVSDVADEESDVGEQESEVDEKESEVEGEESGEYDSDQENREEPKSDTEQQTKQKTLFSEITSRKEFESDDGDDEDESNVGEEESDPGKEESDVEEQESEVEDEESEVEDEESEEYDSEQENGEEPKSGTEKESNQTTLFTETSASKSNEFQKGLCVQNQLKIWENLLEVRIHSQKLLTLSNSLPTSNLLCKFRKLEDKDFDTEIKETQENVNNLLDKMCELQNILVGRYDETKNLNLKLPKNRKRKTEVSIDEYSEILSNNFNTYRPYANTVIQKWFDRTKLFSTNLKSSKSSLKNDFNIINRIDSVMLNKSDLIKKSQQHKGSYSLFNPDIDDTVNTVSKLNKNKIGDGGLDDENVVAVEDGDKEVYCTEIYDDTDFYHQLLRELIEYKATSLSNPVEISKQFAELEKLRKKMKKTVDTRASKGRKIRYVVHKKLVNFMAPNTYSEWTNESKDELFNSLFGKIDRQINVNVSN